MSDVHSIADDQVRSAFRRWQNLEEEKARVADDLKELFAEQKALGHDTKAMRAAFRLKVKLDEADPAEAEHEALVDTYLAALEAPRASRAYAREKTDEFGSIKLMNEQLEAARRSDAGLSIVTKHTEITSSGGSSSAPSSLTTREAEECVVPHSTETVEVPSSEQSEGNGSRDHQHVHSRQTDGAMHGGQDGEPAGADHATISAGSSSGRTSGFDSENAGSNPALASTTDQPLTGGDHEVTCIAMGERDIPTSNTGEGTALSALPAKPQSRLRPNCLQPTMCRSGTRDHCYSCRKAMEQGDAA